MAWLTPTATGAAAAALALGAIAAPAYAEEPPGQISGVAGGLIGGRLGDSGDGAGSADDGQREAQPRRRDLGATSARNGRLRHSCRNYRYRYRVTTPTDDWTLETFLRDPDHEAIASGTFSSDSDPAAARSHFRFCRWVTRPGVFRIRALVHWYDDEGDQHRAWLPTERFRLRRPR